MKQSIFVLIWISILVSGCADPQVEKSNSDGNSSTSPPQESPSDAVKNTSDAAITNLANAVAIARVQLRHKEYDEAEKTLLDALNNSAASDQGEAIALLDEVKTLKKQVQPSEPKTEANQNSQAKVVPTKEADAGSFAKNSTPNPSSPIQDQTEPKKSKSVLIIHTEDPIAPGAEKQQSVEPAQKQDASDALVSAVEREARSAHTAAEALRIYQAFLDQYNLSKEQADRVNSNLKEWEERAKQSLVRLGSEWVSQEEADEAEREADNLITQAYELIKVGNNKEAHRALLRASSVDQNGVRADFLLGMLNSIPYVSSFPDEAEKHFRKVLSRSPGHLSALNNLAICLVKQRKYQHALNYWRQVIEVAPQTREATHNVGRLVSEASLKKLPVSRTEHSKFSTLYSEAITSKGGQAADPNTGWLYMPLVLPKAEKQREEKAKREANDARLVAYGSGTGFAFYKDYLLTNRHVVDDEVFGIADAIRIIDPSDPSHEREFEAELIAISDSMDLAILKCRTFKENAIPLSVELPKRSTEIMILGYPNTTKIGRNLKATKGVVTALPDTSLGNLLLFDAEANPGNSGGPVCDKGGNAVAVLTWKYSDSVGDYTGGIPASQAIPFIKKALPDYDPFPPNDQNLEWPDVDEKVSKSTALIMVYYKEAQLGLSIATTSSSITQNYLEDKSCTACNGHGFLPCPGDGCLRGTISVRVPYKQVVGVGAGAIVITNYRVVKKSCPTCGGSGKVSCPFGM